MEEYTLYIILEGDRTVATYRTYDIDYAAKIIHSLLMDNIGKDVSYTIKTLNYKEGELLI